MLGIDQMTLDPVKLCGGNIHPCGIHGGFAVHQIQIAAIKKHQVVIEFFCQDGPQIKGLLIKGNIFLGPLVGTHDGGVSSGSAKAKKAFFNNGHIMHAVLLR